MRIKILSVLCISLLAIGCAKSSDTPSTPTDSSAPCGVERWQIKNLLDGDVASINWSAMPSSIGEQDTFAQITVEEFTPRLAFEKQTVSIPCTIVEFKREDDSDLHLVLVDEFNDSMIAEVPNVSCAEVATSRNAGDFSKAYGWVVAHLGNPSTSFKQVNVSATITGVLFQDYAHGQKGHAKNYREIHPVTMIE